SHSLVAMSLFFSTRPPPASTPFPTRRSSDLALDVEATALQIRALANAEHAPRNPGACFMYNRPCDFLDACSGLAQITDETKFRRSEEHTSELQSRGHLVCRLLLEKKNTKITK